MMAVCITKTGALLNTFCTAFGERRIFKKKEKQKMGGQKERIPILKGTSEGSKGGTVSWAHE